MNGICMLDSPATSAPTELFPAEVEGVFDRLESIAQADHLYAPQEVRPTAENVTWAKRVLLRVIPRQYLAGAEIDVFHGEIHVSWEYGSKRVVAFLPYPNTLKLYCERVSEDGRVEHELSPGRDPWALNGYLKWLYK